MTNSNISEQFRRHAGLGEPGTSVEENARLIVEKHELQPSDEKDAEQPDEKDDEPQKAPAKKTAKKAAKKTAAK